MAGTGGDGGFQDFVQVDPVRFGLSVFCFADSLVLSLPFAPWPCRWSLKIVASIVACSLSGPGNASKIRLKTICFIHPWNRLNCVFPVATRPRQFMPGAVCSRYPKHGLLKPAPVTAGAPRGFRVYFGSMSGSLAQNKKGPQRPVFTGGTLIQIECNGMICCGLCFILCV